MIAYQECIDFINRMVCDRSQRLGQNGIDDFKKAHPWMAGMDWDNLRNKVGPYVDEAQGKRTQVVSHGRTDRGCFFWWLNSSCLSSSISFLLTAVHTSSPTPFRPGLWMH